MAEDPGEGSYKIYEEYAKTLRTWFVAYGIGGPVLVIGNEKIWAALSKSGELRLIGTCFLIGVGLQILLASLNKFVNWVNYYNESEEIAVGERSAVGKWCLKIGEWVWIDFLFDLASVILFAFSTIGIFRVLTP